jgi:trehalose 6-phosphate synthase complex regulatory subunit
MPPPLEHKGSLLDGLPQDLKESVEGEHNGALVESPAALFKQSRPTARTHFIKPNDPLTMFRSDGHALEWGPTHFFNHPPSTALELPPSRLHGYTLNGDDPNRNRGVAYGGSEQILPKTKLSKGRKREWSHSAKWTIEPAEQGNGGLVNAVKAVKREGGVNEDIFWIGTLGFPTDTLEDNIKQDITEKLDADMDAIAVFVSDSDFEGHYSHYCKTILWPVFHYQIPDHPKSKAYEDHSYEYYRNLNQAFADKVVASYKRGDTIWIHDYHLLLVPKMIRKRIPDAKIGFFLHAAFPSSEVFRCLSVRKDLLEGMLGADLIAFQCPEYEEHFLTTCSRLLIVEATDNGIQLEDRFVNVMSIPIGVDPQGLTEAQQEPDVKKWIEEIAKRYQGKNIVVARDKLDQVRGVRQKLLSYELFLNKYPQHKADTVFIQVATSTTDNNSLSDVVSEIVTRIDTHHNTISQQPLVFLRQDIPYSQYLALLSIADILMVTSLREGMNLTCHEFIMCQEGLNEYGKKFGPVILSEFTGSSSVFKGHDLSVNPWDYQKCADALNQALEMSDEEKKTRYEALHEIVVNNTGASWMRNLVEALDKVYEEHQRQENAAVPRLSFTKLSKAYLASQGQRLFLLDYDGTLASSSDQRSVHLSTSQRVLDTLRNLIIDERNTVYIMSSRTPEDLERIFKRVTNLGVVAETGAIIKRPGKDWWTVFPDSTKTQEWQDSVSKILQYFLERIDGSTLERRRTSLIFKYDESEDQETAARLAGDCVNQVSEATTAMKLHAFLLPNEKRVVIESQHYTKGSAAEYVFAAEKEEKGRSIDFLFVAGDDREDEVAFKWANGLATQEDSKLAREGGVWTVCLGKKNTEAGSTLTQGASGKFRSKYIDIR